MCVFVYFFAWPASVYILLIDCSISNYNLQYFYLLPPSTSVTPMIVEDSQIVPSSLTQIFKNSDQRKRILKIIIQTLYNLGFEQSAAQLQNESKITYLTPEIKAIKSALPQGKYEEVQKILVHSPKYGQICDTLNQLKCMKMIREGRMEDALYLIQNQIKSAQKQDQLSEELMMGTGEIKPQILAKKHHFIVETCFDGEISPNSMFKMINCYMELERRGLTSGISPQFSLLKQPAALRGPPTRIIQTAASLHLKSISFIKFNRNSTKILVVSTHKKQKYVSVWNLNKEQSQLTEYKNCTFSIDQDVVNVSWGYEMGNQLIAIATVSHICVFNCDFSVKNKKKIPTGQHHSNRILCLNWNPLTNFLYIGGAFDNIKVYGPTLEQILTIQPFIRTRNLYFNQQGTHMYAISATKGLFSYYNLFEYKQQAHFATEDAITSFRLENGDKNIVLVTEKKILYIVVEAGNQYKVLYSFGNIFSENGLVEIQACLFYPWVVCLGQKEFQAFGLEKEVNKEEKWNSKESFTFDICNGCMVSGSKELYLWGSRSFRDQLESQKEEQLMQVQDHKNGNGQSLNNNLNANVNQNSGGTSSQDDMDNDDDQEEEEEEEGQGEELENQIQIEDDSEMEPL